MFKRCLHNVFVINRNRIIFASVSSYELIRFYYYTPAIVIQCISISKLRFDNRNVLRYIDFCFWGGGLCNFNRVTKFGNIRVNSNKNTRRCIFRKNIQRIGRLE